MDNEQLKKYIDQNKGALDTHKPSPMLWDNIEEELHPEKKRRGIIWWGRIAAGFAGIIGLFTLYNTGSTDVAIREVQPIPKKDKKQYQSKSLQENVNGNIEPLSEKRNYKKSENVEFIDGEFSSSFSEPLSWTSSNNVTTTTSSGGYTVIVNSTNGCTSIGADGNVITAGTGSSYRGSYESDPNLTYTWYPPENGDDVSKGTFSDDIVGKKDNTIGTEKYDEIIENEFISPIDEPQSTFSIDVDAAGYSNIRRFLNNDQLPPRDAVKLEEMINYFDYDYAEPKGDHPFSFTTEIGVCPWNKNHQLVHIGMQGKSIEKKNIPASNLVFLIDVSGSMQSADKIDLLKKGFKLLTNEMREQDKVSIVVYAGAAGLVLPPTSGNKQEKIIAAIDRLTTGGSTAGGEGIELAYKIATENFKKNGNNRVILATDGDFNVGISEDKDLTKMIEEKRESGVFLTVLGFGSGNFQSSKMEKLADNGNGNFAYIDNSMEAKKVMVNEFGALYTIAKDVKLQVEFNPAKVKGYRLIGYENRMLAAKDFNDDTKDAGELGAGHTVTALYEIIPADSDETVKRSDSTRYFTQNKIPNGNEFMQIKFRYKPPKEDKSKLITRVINESEAKITKNFYWSAAVAELGLLLRDSKFKGESSFNGAYASGNKGLNEDKNGYRHEFMSLIKKTENLR